MAAYLDVSNPEVINQVNKEYEKYKPYIEEEARKDAIDLLNSITYYKYTSQEDIYADIKRRARMKYLEMNDNYALTQALTEKLKEKYKNSKESNEVIAKKIYAEEKTIRSTLKDEQKQDIIKSYKQDKYSKTVEIETKKADDSIMTFSLMSEEEKNNYVGLYYKLSLNKNKYDFRKRAISSVSNQMGVKSPECLKETAPLFNKANRIVNMEEQTEKDKELKTKIKDKIDKLDKAIYQNLRLTLLTIGVSVLTPTVIGMYIIQNSGNEALAIKSVLVGCPLIIAGITAAYKSQDIKDYFHDKKTLDEAKKLGLIDSLVDWSKSSKEFEKYDKKLKKEHKKIEIDGGLKK